MKNIAIIYFGTLTNTERVHFAYCISILKKMPVETKVVNVTLENIDVLLQEVRSFSPVLMVCFFNRYSYYYWQEFSKQISRFKTGHITVCYKIPTTYYYDMLKDYNIIDSVIIGEIENTLFSLASSIIAGEPITSCKGIAFRKEDRIFLSEKSNLIQDIDVLPFPERDQLYDKHRVFHLLGSRGCYGNCSFCDENLMTKSTVRYRSIKNICEEIDYVVREKQCSFIGFSDAAFFDASNGEQRLAELLVRLREKDYWVQFYLNVCATSVHQNVIPYLKCLTEVGLTKVFIGVESFVEADLSVYGKISSVKDNIRAINLLKEVPGLEAEYGFIWFNPYTTLEGLKQNISMTRELGITVYPHQILNKVRVYSCTHLTKRLEQDGLLASKRPYLSPNFRYSFKHQQIAQIYDVLETVWVDFVFEYLEWEPFIINRYTHFYGRDMFAYQLQKQISFWNKTVTSFCLDLLEKLLEKNDKNSMLQLGYKMTKDFVRKNKATYNCLKSEVYKATIKLYRFGDVIFK